VPSRARRRSFRRTSSSRDLRVLKTIAEALNGASDVNQALQTTLEQVAALLGLTTGWIWLTDPRTGRFYSAAAQRLPRFLRQPVRMTGHTCWCLGAFRAGALTAGNIDVMECSRLRAAIAERDRVATEGLRYHASVPLYFGNRPLGIMNVAAPAWRKLTRRELDLLSTIASQVGVAIERARLAWKSVQLVRTEERTRLAREIHDTLAQRLTAIGLHLEAAIDATPRRAAGFAELQRALELSQSGLDEARASMRQLRASSGQPLAEGLDSLAHAFTAETGIRVHVRSVGEPQLKAPAEDELLRIAGEALTNVRKHAHATDVDVSLTSDGKDVVLDIVDNGTGFNPRRRTSGFGLLGMRERARGIGGRLQVTSRPRRGTRVAFSIRIRQ
jgi:two-component system NarL family sensor kinase